MKLTRQHNRANAPTPVPKGFTLVELMVAITIGLIILAAVSQIFATSRSTYTLEEGLARLQESGRFAMEFISNDLRMAGYIGCQDQLGTVENRLNNPGEYAITGQIVSGHTYTGPGTARTAWTPALPATYFVDGEVVANTDVVLIRRASEQALAVIAPYMTAETDPITIPVGNGLKQWDIVMVADCKGADMFQVTNGDPDADGKLEHTTASPPAPKGPGNAFPDLKQLYGSNAEILRIVTHAYYVGNGASGPSLFRKELLNGQVQARELVENVETLQFFYGVDADNTGVANQFMKADVVDLNPANWNTVASVRIGLLARTPDETGIDVDKTIYDVAGSNFDPTDDRRQRRVFTSTVNVRNYTAYTR